MRQLKFTGFMIIGFLMTVIIWGFIGGCGTKHSLDYSLNENLIEDRTVNKEDTGEPARTVEEEAVTTNAVHYTVKKGDTIWGISRRYGVGLEDLRRVNRLTGDTIFPGQVLIIPQKELIRQKEERKGTVETTPDTGKEELIVYKVRRGDSLWRIAQKCGTTVERILAINGLRKDSRLMPGQELLVPKYETKR